MCVCVCVCVCVGVCMCVVCIYGYMHACNLHVCVSVIYVLSLEDKGWCGSEMELM